MFYSCILIGERVREKERGGERERERDLNLESNQLYKIAFH